MPLNQKFCILWTLIVGILGKTRNYLCRNNDWESNGTLGTNSPSEESSDEGFEIVEFDPDRDDNLSKYDCLQSNRIDLTS